ncbi:MAG: hypothetical protein ACTTJV_06975 [Ottowia sp.]
MRLLAWFIAAAGLLVFGALLALSFVDPLTVEKLAREVARQEVQRRVGERVAALDDARITQMATRALARTRVDLQRQREALRQKLPEQVAQRMADLLNVDCECRKQLTRRARQSAQAQAGALQAAQDKLLALIDGMYAHVRAQLLREWRIVTGSTALAFALLAATLAWRRAASWHALLPAAVLLGALGMLLPIYLGQDWLHTVIWNDYWGWSYTALLALFALMLADVAFNRARVLTSLLNGISTNALDLSIC